MNTEEMIDPNNLTFRGATPEDLDFVAWCNYTASSPAPGFCWWDPLIEGIGIKTITFFGRQLPWTCLPGVGLRILSSQNTDQHQ